MHWKAKALAQNLISMLPEPYSEEVNQWVSRRFGLLGKSFPDFGFENTRKMVDALRGCAVTLKGLDVLEIGTGWSCLSALTLAQYGTRRIKTIDLYRHVRDDMVNTAVQYILERHEMLGSGAPPRGLVGGQAPAQVLASAGVAYEAPVNLLEMQDNERYDLVYAHAVMEHVPARILKPFMQACHRLLRPGGVCFQLVQPADHYSWAVGARGVSPYNFLKYREWWFNFAYNPRVAHQNRWRCSRYLSLFKEVGFEVSGIPSY